MRRKARVLVQASKAVAGALIIAALLGHGEVQAQTEPEWENPFTRWEKNPKGTKITGGWAAQIRHWPGFAALRFRTRTGSNVGYFCGGVMIDKRWMLTAAHCLRGWTCPQTGSGCTIDAATRSEFGFTGQAEIEVVASDDDLTKVTAAREAAIVYKVVRIIPHQEFTEGRKGNDIALVHIGRDYPGPYARLAMPEDDPSEDFPYPVMVAGFGRTVSGPTSQTKLERSSIPGPGETVAATMRLQETLVPTVPNVDCQKRLTKHQIQILPSQLCATDEKSDGRDTCSGDSGGPLVAFDKKNWPYVVGLTSFGGAECGGKDKFPGIYTRVSKFRTWIDQQPAVVKTTSVPSQLRHAKNAHKQVWDESGKFKPGQSRLTLNTCERRDRASCNDNDLPTGSSSILVKATSDIGGRLVIVLVTRDGRVEQVFPSPNGAAAVEPGAEFFLPAPLAFGWDLLGARLIGVVLPVGGPNVVTTALRELDELAKPATGTARQGQAQNGVDFLRKLRAATEASGRSAAVHVLQFRKQ